MRLKTTHILPQRPHKTHHLDTPITVSDHPPTCVIICPPPSYAFVQWNLQCSAPAPPPLLRQSTPHAPFFLLLQRLAWDQKRWAVMMLLLIAGPVCIYKDIFGTYSGHIRDVVGKL